MLLFLATFFAVYFAHHDEVQYCKCNVISINDPEEECFTSEAHDIENSCFKCVGTSFNECRSLIYLGFANFSEPGAVDAANASCMADKGAMTAYLSNPGTIKNQTT